MSAHICQQYLFNWIWTTNVQAQKIQILVNLGLLLPALLFLLQAYRESSDLVRQVCFCCIITVSPIVGYCYWALLDVLMMFSGGHMKSNLPISEALLCVIFLCVAVFYMIIVIIIDVQYHAIGKERSYNKEAEKRPTYVFDQESLDKEQQRVSDSSPDDAIIVNGIKKVFNVKTGDFYALKGTSFTLRENEILGLLGPNGAGKSTTFNILSAFLRRSDGEISLQGKSFDYIKTFFKETGICFQDDIFWERMSIGTNLKLFGMIRGVPKENIERWLKILDLENFKSRDANNLSSGMKRKLCIIMCMFSNPKYKFLDEPSTGLDPVARNHLRYLIKEQRKYVKDGSTIFTTHTMNEAELLCDRIAILVNGGYSCISNVHDLQRKAAGYNLTITFHYSEDTASKKS